VSYNQDGFQFRTLELGNGIHIQDPFRLMFTYFQGKGQLQVHFYGRSGHGAKYLFEEGGEYLFKGDLAKIAVHNGGGSDAGIVLHNGIGIVDGTRGADSEDQIQGVF